MELTKKTTILFPPDLHKRLSLLARQKGVSMGHLVRLACREKFGLSSKSYRLEAIEELAAMSLPVGDPKSMKAESVPEPSELLK